MTRKKILVRCPDCRSRLNPKDNIGTIGICRPCGWVGSYSSQNASDWKQLKVSSLLIAIGLMASYGILSMDIQTTKSYTPPHKSLQSGPHSTEPNSPTPNLTAKTKTPLPS